MKCRSYRVWFRVALFLLLVFSVSAVTVAQSRGGRGMVSFGRSAGLANDTLYLDVNQDIAVQLMPFDELLKVAVAYSPIIRQQTEITNSLDAAYDQTRTQVLQNVSGFAGYSTGNQLLVASGVGVPNRDPIGQISNGYRVGVNLSLSLFDVVGRKHQIRQAYANYRAAVVQRDILELQVRRELIALYQDMITSQQLLKIQLLEEQSALTALRLAEAEQLKGRITARELAEANSRYVQARAVTEQNKGAFLKNIHFMEALMGVPIQRLKRIN